MGMSFEPVLILGLTACVGVLLRMQISGRLFSGSKQAVT